MEILETFPQMFCFPKSLINENGGRDVVLSGYTLQNPPWSGYQYFLEPHY